MTGANRQIFALAIAAAAAYLVATALRSLPIYEALGARAVRSVGATERRRRAQSA
jgi:H+/Cl- antiporter ClcA